MPWARTAAASPAACAAPPSTTGRARRSGRRWCARCDRCGDRRGASTRHDRNISDSAAGASAPRGVPSGRAAQGAQKHSRGGQQIWYSLHYKQITTVFFVASGASPGSHLLCCSRSAVVCGPGLSLERILLAACTRRLRPRATPASVAALTCACSRGRSGGTVSLRRARGRSRGCEGTPSPRPPSRRAWPGWRRGLGARPRGAGRSRWL